MHKRLIGIDYGRKKIGIALADPSNQFALPYVTVDTGKNLFISASRIAKALVNHCDIDRFIVGLPVHLSSHESAMSKEVRKFADKLEEVTDRSVEFVDERLTSRQSETLLRERGMRRKESAKVIDVLSATSILQTYLDLNCMNLLT